MMKHWHLHRFAPLVLTVGLFGSLAASAAQFDCEVVLNAHGDKSFQASFYGESKPASSVGEFINQNFELNHIDLKLRVLYRTKNQRLMLQLSQPGNDSLWLSSEAKLADNQQDVNLVFAGKLISPELDGLSVARCKMR